MTKLKHRQTEPKVIKYYNDTMYEDIATFGTCYLQHLLDTYGIPFSSVKVLLIQCEDI